MMSSQEQDIETKVLVKLAITLAKFIFPLSRWLSYISIIAAAGMMFIIAADVFLRRAFNSPIFGAYEVIRILLVVIVFCAVAYVMTIRGHIIVDSITRLYPRKLNFIVIGFNQFLSMIILALICWQSISYGMTMVQTGENMVLLRISVAPFIFLVAFGCALFFLVVLVQLIFTLAGVDEAEAQRLSSSGRKYG